MEGVSRRILVAIGIVIEGERVLIARRPNSVPLGGLWEFPGGKMEPGETAELTAIREIKEELDLDVHPVGRLAPTEHAYPHGTVVLTPILCRPVAGVPRAMHCTEFRWVLPGELASYPFPDGNVLLLQKLAAVPLGQLLASQG